MRILKNFFHKIKTTIIRATNPSIPYVDDIKRFGNEAEDDFIKSLILELPSCEIKRNIIINTPNGNAEIDFLILYENRLFAIELKSWKGVLIETEDSFVQEKRDKWTGEIHTKYLKSPFKQLKRAIYLLKNSSKVDAWINPIIYFYNEELESIIIDSEDDWFDNTKDIVNFIINNDNKSSKNAKTFFDNCICADYLYSNFFDKSISCIINRPTLVFKTEEYTIPPEKINYITIKHHLTYDELYIVLIDNSTEIVRVENGSIDVDVNGFKKTYFLSKLDHIKLGSIITSI